MRENQKNKRKKSKKIGNRKVQEIEKVQEIGISSKLEKVGNWKKVGSWKKYKI